MDQEKTRIEDKKNISPQQGHLFRERMEAKLKKSQKETWLIHNHDHLYKR